MPNRKQVRDFYQNRGVDLARLTKSGPTDDRYMFRGPAVVDSVVVRIDLNGYSAWSQDKGLDKRVELLDDFFSKTVLELEKSGGVFYREEGDCIVGLFSTYFKTGATYSSVRSFCITVTSKTYGNARLDPKTVVTCGNLAFFQKSHEAGSDEWSAEGHPFVLASRIEAAIDSKQRIYFVATQYRDHFESNEVFASPGTPHFWTKETKGQQVPGLQLSGGWLDLTFLEYIPGGRVS